MSEVNISFKDLFKKVLADSDKAVLEGLYSEKKEILTSGYMMKTVTKPSLKDASIAMKLERELAMIKGIKKAAEQEAIQKAETEAMAFAMKMKEMEREQAIAAFEQALNDGLIVPVTDEPPPIRPESFGAWA